MPETRRAGHANSRITPAGNAEPSRGSRTRSTVSPSATLVSFVEEPGEKGPQASTDRLLPATPASLHRPHVVNSLAASEPPRFADPRFRGDAGVLREPYSLRA